MQRFLFYKLFAFICSPFYALLNVSEFSSFQHFVFFLTRSKEKSVLDGFFVPKMKREVAAKRSVVSPLQKQHKAALYLLNYIYIILHLYLSICPCYLDGDQYRCPRFNDKARYWSDLGSILMAMTWSPQTTWLKANGSVAIFLLIMLATWHINCFLSDSTMLSGFLFRWNLLYDS